MSSGRWTPVRGPRTGDVWVDDMEGDGDSFTVEYVSTKGGESIAFGRDQDNEPTYWPADELMKHWRLDQPAEIRDQLVDRALHTHLHDQLDTYHSQHHGCSRTVQSKLSLVLGLFFVGVVWSIAVFAARKADTLFDIGWAIFLVWMGWVNFDHVLAERSRAKAIKAQEGKT